MAEIPYTNNTGKTVHIGTKRITPGDTRDVEETLIPGYQPPAKTQSEPEALTLADILEGKVADIRAQLQGLDDVALVQLQQLEEAGQDRKGVHAAISEEQLRRANKKEDETGESEEGTPDH